MADANQSDLSITGIGGDPSGSHPIGNLDANWTAVTDDGMVRFTATTIMDIPTGAGMTAGAVDTGAVVTAYSKEFKCTAPLASMYFWGGALGDAQIEGCWQWYNPMTGSEYADFSSDGRVGTFGNGTWTDCETPAGDIPNVRLDPDSTDELEMMEYAEAFRIKVVFTDVGTPDGIADSIVTTAVNMVNTSYVVVDVTKTSLRNKAMVASYSGEPTAGSIGGIGADPS